jgi:uncharacterized membrane protein
MRHFAEYASQSLGVRLPEGYTRFMETHGNRLPEDPVKKKSWIAGLGSREFVIGTTLAFRSSFPNFGSGRVVIGCAGTKTIIVNKAYEEIDEYLVLDAGDESIQTIDSLGVTTRIAGSFEEWITPELQRAMLREKYAGSFAAVVFDEPDRAEEARFKLLKLQQEGFVELEDIIVVARDQHGTIRHHELSHQGRKEGLLGSITGFIVGSILFNPILGGVLGVVTGAVAASLSDTGIDYRFVEDLSKDFKPGCSALFTLVGKADPDRVENAFLGFGGRILVSSLSAESEAAIQAFLNETSESAEQLDPVES